MVEERPVLFPIVRLVISAGAVRALAAAGRRESELVVAHQRGDWGAVTAAEAARNERAVRVSESTPPGPRERLRSAFVVGDGGVCVVTERGWDLTAVLLPEEAAGLPPDGMDEALLDPAAWCLPEARSTRPPPGAATRPPPRPAPPGGACGSNPLRDPSMPGGRDSGTDAVLLVVPLPRHAAGARDAGRQGFGAGRPPLPGW